MVTVQHKRQSKNIGGMNFEFLAIMLILNNHPTA